MDIVPAQVTLAQVTASPYQPQNMRAELSSFIMHSTNMNLSENPLYNDIVLNVW